MDFNHGTATVKETLCDREGNILRRVGEIGVITAFLPEVDKYAVMFDGLVGVGNFFTLDKVSFDKFFEYEVKEE